MAGFFNATENTSGKGLAAPTPTQTNGILVIFGVRAPGQITQTVVGTIPVKVSTFHTWRARANKGRQNKFVYFACLPADFHGKIPA